VHGRGYEGWCDLFFWDGRHWQTVGEPNSGLGNEDSLMADGTRSGDLLQWHELYPEEILPEAEKRENGAKQLRDYAKRQGSIWK
jgi:hypothetical protein